MDNKDVPSWILSLESDDLEFIRKFPIQLFVYVWIV